MKVTRNTPDQLILSNNPWVLGVILIVFILVFVGVGLTVFLQGDWFGLLFIIMGGGIGAATFCGLVRRVQVILNRPAGTITIQRRSVFGYTRDDHDLSRLQRADVESSTTRTDRGTSTVHRAVLVMGDGTDTTPVPIVKAYYGGPGAQELADAVNDWLPARSLDSGTATD
ncbi:MAG: hypothetical protein AB3N23_06775 [Paracoccaceae bacterium]